MKQRKFIFLGTLLMFIFMAFKPNFNPTNTDPATYKVMEMAFLWDLLKDGYEPDRNRDDTWLDVGLRSKYAMAKKYASIEIIENTFGVPVFVKGPHKGYMNFNSTRSFGHYNPAFISKLRSSLETALQNPLYRKALQKVYTKHLKSMADTYHAAHIYLHKDPAYLQNLKTEYSSLISEGSGTIDGSLQEKFRSFAEDLERNQKGDVYEGFTAPAFWLRRSIDGSSSQLFDLLKLLQKEFENNQKVIKKDRLRSNSSGN